MTRTKTKPLVSVRLNSEHDVILIRRRSRIMAELLGLTLANQTKLCTAVSEMARNAQRYGVDAKVQFMLSDSIKPYMFIVRISDHGPGIEDLTEVLSRTTGGIHGARNLVDEFEATTSAAGTEVTLSKLIPARSKPYTPEELNDFNKRLEKLAHEDPLDELHLQNQALLDALDQLTKREQELADKNEQLSERNRQLIELQETLEQRVLERTKELETAKDDVVKAGEVKSRFVNNLSHELRTPMSGVIGMAELLSVQPELSAESKELAHFVMLSGSNLLYILNDLIEFAQLQENRIELFQHEFSLEVLMSGVFEDAKWGAENKTLKLSSSVDPRIPKSLLGDVVRVRQVLMILIHNAIKFTREGTVTIDAAGMNPRDGVVEVCFSVVDTGIGISEEGQKNLFDSFVQGDGSSTRRYGGNGLGLYIAKQLIDLMDGEIGVYSREGEGATFWFCVPLKFCETAQ